MTPENFCYWLQGYFEIADTADLSKKQTRMIREHLGLIFTKVTEDFSSSGYHGYVSTGSGYSGYCGICGTSGDSSKAWIWPSGIGCPDYTGVSC